MTKRAIDAVLNQPWAITDEGMELVASVAAREHEYFGNVEALEAKLGRQLNNTQTMTVRDGVALLPIEGPLFAKANLLTMISGATSYDLLATDFTAALEDPAVKAIVGVFDTPGGAVTGASEFAAMVAAARGKKPLVAFITGQMASAGYWIGSAFDTIVGADVSLTGSIGAQMGTSVPDPKPGEKSYRFISSQSPEKNASPATEAGSAQYQKIVNDLADVFVNTVAENRGITSEKVLESFGKGAVFVAADALQRGMIDKIGTLEGVLTDLKKEAENMDFTTITAAALAENRPDLVAAFRAEGAATIDLATARAEGAKAERERIIAIEALAMPGTEAVIAAAKADPDATAETTGLKVLAALRSTPVAAAKPSTASAALTAMQEAEASFEAPVPTESKEDKTGTGSIDAMLEIGREAGVLRS